MSFPADLDAHLAREVTTLCHCWRLTRRDGMAFGFTDHDYALSFADTVFAPDSGLAASEARESLGLAVDTAEVDGALSSAAIDAADVAAGLYDGATVETFLVNWRSPASFALIRRATVGKITRSDGRFVAELETAMHALERPSGRIVSRRCDAELGDARCRFSLDTPGFRTEGTALAAWAADAVLVAGLDNFEAGWFSHGVLAWTAGARAGRTERVLDHRIQEGGVLLVLDGTTQNPEPGDTFTVTAGCDKAFATCKAKFANVENFRGFPHLPGNDAAYGYVVDGGVFDGAPLVP